MFAWNLFVAAEDDFLEGLLEVVIEGDVDHGVDHGVAVREHVEPEPVLLHQAWQLTWAKGMFIVHVGRHLWSCVVLRGKFISRLFLSCWCSTFLWHNPRQLNFQRKATWRCYALSLPLLFQSLNFHDKNHLERFMYLLNCEFSATYLGFCEEYCVVHKNLVRRPVK